jgi:hypothetical protein
MLISVLANRLGWSVDHAGVFLSTPGQGGRWRSKPPMAFSQSCAIIRYDDSHLDSLNNEYGLLRLAH